jgi:hypothetical protein
VLISL